MFYIKLVPSLVQNQLRSQNTRLSKQKIQYRIWDKINIHLSNAYQYFTIPEILFIFIFCRTLRFVYS